MQGLLHAGVEEAVGVAPGGFGFVHGQVCAFEQFVHALAFGAKRSGRCWGAVVLLAASSKGLVQRHEEFARDGFGLAAGGVGVLVQAFEQDDEFVAAKARNGVAFAHAGREAGATWMRSWSPMSWPRVSLRSLKLSRSMNSSAPCWCARWPLSSRRCRRSSSRRRLERGEGVVEGQAFDLLGCALAVGDVAGHAEQARGVARPGRGWA